MRRSAGEWAARVAAFVFAGAAVALGVSILASWVGLNGPIVAVVVVVFLAVLGHRILSLPDEQKVSPDKEQS
jgi:hypothetical protein